MSAPSRAIDTDQPGMRGIGPPPARVTEERRRTTSWPTSSRNESRAWPELRVRWIILPVGGAPLPGRDRVGLRPKAPLGGPRLPFGLGEGLLAGVADEVPGHAGPNQLEVDV